MINVGAMVASMTLDTKGFALGMQKVTKSLTPMKAGLVKLGTVVKQMSKHVLNLRNAFFALGVAMASRQVMGQFQKFQVALVDMGKVTSRSLAGIRKEVLSLDSAIGTSIELMKGYYQVISAGVKTAAKQLDTLVVSSKAAIAAHVSQSEVIKGLTAIVDAYEGKVRGAAEAADILFTIERLGKTTVAELIPIIGSLASMSATMKISQDELGGSLAQLTKFIGSTAEAATQLKALYTALITPNEQLNALFEEQGGVLKAIGKIGFVNVLKRMDEATQGNVEALKLLMEGRREALLGFLSLSKQGFVPTIANIEEMAKKTGAADKAFRDWKKTLEATYTIFRATIGKVMIEMGQELLPTVQKGIIGIAEWLEKYQDTIISVTRTMVEFIEKIGEVWRLLVAFPTGVIKQFKDMGEAAEEAGEKIRESFKPPDKTTWQEFVTFMDQWGQNIIDISVFVMKFLGRSFALLVGDAIEAAKIIAKEFKITGKIIWLALTLQFKKVKEEWGKLSRGAEDFTKQLERNWEAWGEGVAKDFRTLIGKMFGLVEDQPSMVVKMKIEVEKPKPVDDAIIISAKETDEELRAIFQATLEWERNQQSESLKEILEDRKASSIEQLTAMRSMYEDMSEYPIKYFDVVEALIDKQAKIYEDLVGKEIDVTKWAAAEKEKIHRQHWLNQRDLELQAADSIVDSWTYVFQQLGRKSERAFEGFKRMQQIQAVIDAIRVSLSAFKWGWEYGGPAAPYVSTAMMISAGIAAFAKVALIESQQYKGYAAGGWLGRHPRGGRIGEGGGDRDDVFLGATPGVNHWATKDEFVMNPAASRKYGNLLEVMNRGYLFGGGLSLPGLGGGGLSLPGLGGGGITTDPLAGAMDLPDITSFFRGVGGLPPFKQIYDWWEELTAIPEPEFDPDAFAGILHSIDQMLGLTSALDDKLYSTNIQFDGWIKQLTDMGASVDQLNQVEGQRATVLAHLTAEMQKDVWDGINEQVAELTGRLTDFQWEVIGVDKQFDAMVDSLKDVNMAYDELGNATGELLAVELARIQAINYLIDVQKETLEEDIARRLGELQGTLAPEELAIYDLTKEFVTLMEEIKGWSEVTGEGYEDLVADATRTYELEMQAALAQTAAAKEMESSISAWTDIVSGIDDTLYDLRTSLASPATAMERMGLVRGMIEAFPEVATPEQAAELQQLWLDYLNLAQEAYQRPSSDYQAIWNQVIGALEGIRTDAEDFVSSYELDLATAIDISQILLTEQGMATSLSQIATDIMAGIPVELDLTTEDFVVTVPTAEEVAGAIGTIEVPTIPPVDVIIPDVSVSVAVNDELMKQQKTVLEEIRANTHATANNVIIAMLKLPGKSPAGSIWPPYAKYGGIFTGPESGYPVMLHGTEAVVPLSDGGSAGMGKTEINVNINESRTPRETSREVVRGIEQFLRGSKGRAMMQEGAKGR